MLIAVPSSSNNNSSTIWPIQKCRFNDQRVFLKLELLIESILSLFRKYFVALRTERIGVQGEKRHNLQTLQMKRECKVKRQIKVQWIWKKEKPFTKFISAISTNRQNRNDKEKTRTHKNWVIIRNQKRLKLNKRYKHTHTHQMKHVEYEKATR